MSTRPKRTGTHEFSDGIEWIQGNADPEITEDPSDMSWINEAARNKWGRDTGKVRTYGDFESYLGDRGIESDTASETLKTEFYGRDMPKAVEKQAGRITAALDDYDETGGVRGLKKSHPWDDSDDVTGQAAYCHRALDEAPFDNEEGIYFKNGNLRMHHIVHGSAHAYADGTEPKGHDVVTRSAELDSEAMPDESRGAYFGAASDVIEAERFADAVAGAFVTNNPENRAMPQAFPKRVAEVIGEMV